MYKKNRKNLYHKLAASMLATTMIFSAVGVPIMAMESDVTLVEPVQDKDNYYDIDTHMESNIDVREPKDLMAKVLLSQPDDSDKTILENWAVLACGMFADIPSSYAIEEADGRFGELKHLSDFKAHFSDDVKEGKDNYGNLYKLLSSKDSRWQSTNDSIYSEKYHQDINTYSTGLKYAANLNDVQDEAFNQLANLNDREYGHADDYRKQHEIKAMSDTKGEDSPVLYSIVATRDKKGILSCYQYNAMGIAFYDFKLEETPSNSGFSISVPLTDAQKETIKKNIAAGSNVDLAGFKLTKNSGSSTTYAVNNSTSPMSSSHAFTKHTSRSVSDTNSISHSFTSGSEKNGSYTVDTSKTILSALFSGELSGGYSLTTEEAQSFTKDHNVTTENSEETTSSHEYEIPAYSAAELEQNTNSKQYEEAYNRPVYITYKVAVFSMAGGQKGSRFDFDTYSQRSFFSEIGSDQTAAWKNLKDRTNASVIKDYTFSKAHGLTKLTGKSYVSDFFWPWSAHTVLNFNWDSPYIDSIRWDEVINKANLMGIDGNDATTGEKAVKTLTTQFPVSQTSGTIVTKTASEEIKLKGFISTKQLETVSLADNTRGTYDIAEGTTLPLNSIRLIGTNTEGTDFVGFNPNLGTWVLTDEYGNFIEDCDLGTVTKDASGNPIFKAATGQTGTAYLKYIVNDNVYRVYGQDNVDSSKVNTPVIAVTVKSNVEVFEGQIEIPNEINVTYTPGESIDLNSLRGLDVNIYDSKGHLIDKPVEWAAKKKYGMTLTDGKLNITEDGDYMIRAEHGDVFSNWMTVHAQAAPQTEQEAAPEDGLK